VLRALKFLSKTLAPGSSFQKVADFFLKLLRNKDGWPFPEWYGACGRLIVQSYEGLTIDNYLNHSFQFRVKLMINVKLIGFYKFEIKKRLGKNSD